MAPGTTLSTFFMYYFAYGSNMDDRQMKTRCPSARFLTVARLPGYRLAFTIFSSKRNCGCADIVADPSGTVFGILYEISQEDIARLDVFEGVPGGHYRRITLNVILDDGRRISTEAYVVARKSKTPIPPSKQYMGLLISAAVKRSFPKQYRIFLESIETTGH